MLALRSGNAQGEAMARATLLLADDDDVVRYSLSLILSAHGYDVTAVSNVAEALQCISRARYNVLLTDLHMPGKGDGLTIISAMHHANPDTVTILLSALPAMQKAAETILLQVDQILVKPTSAATLIKVIEQRLAGERRPSPVIASVAVIITRSLANIIDAWYERVMADTRLMTIAMSKEQRIDHLPQLCRDLATRLRSASLVGTKSMHSSAATQHGRDRRRQGYTASMLVEESRMLQISVFETLQEHLAHLNFSLLLNDMVTVADEMNWQLSQAMESYAEGVPPSLHAA